MKMWRALAAGLFFCLAVFALVSSLYAKLAADRRNAVTARIEAAKKEIEVTKLQRSALEEEINEAVDLEAWVLASMPLQPLVVTVLRSMDSDSEIVEFSLERDADKPSQLRLGLKLNTASDKQLEKTLAEIRAMNYQEFNQTQTRVQGNLDYRANLIWQDPGGKRQTPEERTAAGGGSQ